MHVSTVREQMYVLTVRVRVREQIYVLTFGLGSRCMC